MKNKKPMGSNSHDMTANQKEWIQYSTAVLMLVSSVVLSFLSFFLNNYDIADGVLWYVAQALTYTGSIFGVSIYFKTKLGEAENRFRQYVEQHKEGVR